MKKEWECLFEKRFCIDSRNVEPGCVFVAIRGGKHDGHDFVKEALSKGASLAVVERSVGGNKELVVGSTIDFLLSLASEKLNSELIIGVTGSSGKTLTKELISKMIPGSFYNPGNMNTEIGLPLSILNGFSGQRIAVLEMGMDKRGDIRKLCSYFPPKIGVVLNATRQHIGIAGSEEEIFLGKMEMFESSERCVYNADDERMRDFVEKLGKTRIGFGMRKGNVILKDWKYEGLKTVAVYEIEGEEALLLLPGVWHRGHLLDLAAAISTLKILDLPLELSWVKSFEFLPGRFKLLNLRGIIAIDDTYNASLEAFEAAIEAMLKMRANRRIAVVGPILEQGAFAKDTHEKLSEILERIDGVFVFDGAEESIWIRPRNLIYRSEDVGDLARAISKEITVGDVALFKASRGVRIERVLNAYRRMMGW